MRPGTLAPRADTWPQDLSAYLAAARATPFAWGTHDCGTFSCDWVAAAIGVDPFAPWRGTYASEAEFEALVAPAGGLEAFVAAAAAAVGILECPAAFAQRGDVAIALAGNQPCLGLIEGRHVAVPTLAGMRLAPRLTIQRAWAI